MDAVHVFGSIAGMGLLSVFAYVIVKAKKITISWKDRIKVEVEQRDQ